MSEVFKPKQPIDPSLGALMAAAGADVSQYTSTGQRICGFCSADMQLVTITVPQFLETHRSTTMWQCPECGHAVDP